MANRPFRPAGTSRSGRWSPETAKRQLPQHVQNIRMKYEDATPDDLARGRDWYANAQRIAHEIGRGNVEKGAGIIAALSPSTEWNSNVEGARHVARTGTPWTGGNATGINNQKALRILAGEHPIHDGVLGGHKVLSFYHNIVHLDDPNVVTVDRHAHAVAMGIPPGTRNKQKINLGLSAKPRYDHFVDAYTQATHKFSNEDLPSTLQAITWTTQLRQKGERSV